MEGDAGSGRLNPTPPTTDDDAERGEAEDSVNPAPADDDAQRSQAEESVNPTPADDEAEPGEAEAAALSPADEPRPDGAEAATSPQSRLSSRRWIAGVCSVLVLLSLAMAAGGYLAVRSNQKSSTAARAEAAALEAAKDCVAATQAPDATAMAASREKIIDCATGDFGAQATLYSGLLVDAYKSANVRVQVSDMRAAVERHNSDGSMDVLVAVRVRVSNTQQKDQEQGYRLRVRMAPDSGAYKIARLDQVSK